MPPLKRSLPKYCKHRASGQAVVTLSGVDFYLGPHGTKTSRMEYDRLVAEWLQNGRQVRQAQDDLTVVELLAAYKRFAKTYYRKNGQVTRELGCTLESARFVTRLYGRTPAAEFGPLALQVVQQEMIAADLCRKTINDHTNRIKRVFKWGVAQQLIPPATSQALQTVPGLRKGRTGARESEPVLPVDDAVVEATLAHLPDVVADMVRLQRLTGCRPGEVCTMRPCDIDTSQEVWVFRPENHKTEHHDRQRVICIGPIGMAWALVKRPST